MNRRNFLRLNIMAAVTLPLTEIIPQDTGSFEERILRRIEEFQIEKCGQSLANHPAILERPKLSYDFDLLFVTVAQHWRLLPSELNNVSLADKVDMCAWYIALQQIELTELWDAREKAKRKRI